MTPPTLHPTAARTLAIGILAATLFAAACSGEGAAKLKDQLTWRANRMNIFDQDQSIVTYHHHTSSPYWIVAAPPGTTRADLMGSRVPAAQIEFIVDCLANGEPVLAVVEDRRAGCLRPATFPDVTTFIVAAKSGGEPADVVVRRNGRALELASIE